MGHQIVRFKIGKCVRNIAILIDTFKPNINVSADATFISHDEAYSLPRIML